MSTSLFGNTQTGSSLFGGSNTGGSLFGGNNNKPQTGGLFGNPTQTTNLFSNPNPSGTGGLLGGNNQNTGTQNNILGGNNQTNTGTSLFGNTNNQGGGNTGTSLFGNQNQNSGGNSLFGNSGNSLFGGNNKPTTIFNNQPQQSGSLFSTGTFFTPPTTQQNSLFSNNNLTSLNSYPSKRDLDATEIQNLFQTIFSAYHPSSPANLFKYFLYTRIPNGTDGRMYQQYSPYVKTEDGVNNCIDYDLWLKATQANTNPRTTFPTQISSPKQFVSRLKTNEIYLLSVLEEIVKMQKNLETLNIKCGNEIDSELYNAKDKMKKIKNLLTLVSTKMAKLGIRTGRVDKNVALEKRIEERLISIKSHIKEEGEINRHINMLRNASLENTTIDQYETNYMKDMNKMRIDKNINVLRQMKLIIDTQFGNLNKNIKIINGIQNDLNQLNRYGKIK